jgi:glycosyltransferase involved in cell wall biosynthesis
MTSPLVSILITCYQFEAYIEEAIRSLLAQRGGYEIEIIVFDDNSPDNSAQIIRSIQDERIIFIHNQENKGATACINKGFEMAKGKYICRFDGDDKWQPNFLATLIPILEENPDVGMVFGNYMPIDAEGNSFAAQKIGRPTHLQTKDNDFKEILKQYYINAPTIIFRKEALKTVFPVPQKFGNFLDWYVSLSVLSHWKGYYYDDALAYYRIHYTNNHRRAVVDGTDEKITEIILQEFLFSNPLFNETDKRKIVGKHYYNLAMKYYAADMPKDANRCFQIAFRHQKKYLGNIHFMQYYFINRLGKKRYEQLKKYINKLI